MYTSYFVYMLFKALCTISITQQFPLYIFFFLSLSLFLSCSLFEFLTADVRCSIFSTQYSILNIQYYSERVGVFIIFCFVSTYFFSSSLVCSFGYMFSRFFQSSIFFSLFLPFFHYSFYLPIYQSTNLFTSSIQVEPDQSTNYSLQSVVQVPVSVLVSVSGSNPNSVLVNAFIQSSLHILDMHIHVHFFYIYFFLFSPFFFSSSSSLVLVLVLQPFSPQFSLFLVLSLSQASIYISFLPL